MQETSVSSGKVVVFARTVQMRGSITIGSSSIRKEYPSKRKEEENPVAPLAFIPVSVKEKPQQKEWQVEQLVLQSPTGETVEIKSTSLSVVAMLLVIML